MLAKVIWDTLHMYVGVHRGNIVMWPLATHPCKNRFLRLQERVTDPFTHTCLSVDGFDFIAMRMWRGFLVGTSPHVTGSFIMEIKCVPCHGCGKGILRVVVQVCHLWWGRGVAYTVCIWILSFSRHEWSDLIG